MKCKYCEAELEEGLTICSSCGADLSAEEVIAEQILQAPAEEEQTVVCEQTPAEPEGEEQLGEELAEQPRKKRRFKLWQVIVGAVASVVLLAALAVVLLYAFGVDLRPRPNDIHKKDQYTVSDEKAAKAGDKVIAVTNGKELTNGVLQMYYKMQVVDFLNNNSSYLSYLKLDLEKPLSEQPCYYDETLSWEQYFIDVAIETWHNYQSVYALSVQDGFVPSEDLCTSLDELPAGLEEMAAQEKFESADELIKDRFGPACTAEDYLDYCRVYYVSAEYINVTPSMDELENFYTANESLFVENGIDKQSGPLVNARHILLFPEGGTPVEGSDEVTFTDEEWAACYAKAEALLNQWKEGEATEESFATLANTHSEDGGSNTNGGLYTGITKQTNFVENFLNWCMDESRQVGDTGIVQTEYGYHIMYFAYTQPQWLYYANTYFLSDRTSQMIEAANEKWHIEITYKHIALPELDIY